MREGPKDMYVAYLIRSHNTPSVSSSWTSDPPLDPSNNEIMRAWSRPPSSTSLASPLSVSSLILSPLPDSPQQPPMTMDIISPGTEINGHPQRSSMDSRQSLLSAFDTSSFDEHFPDLSLEYYSDEMKLDYCVEPTGCPQNLSWAGFSLEQTDPVEARCEEIRDMFRKPGSSIMAEEITDLITRANLIHLCALFGRHFLRHYPVLHRPSFHLTDTSPHLLLAMLIIGECYSDLVVNANLLIRLAVGLLQTIECSPVSDPSRPISASAADEASMNCILISCRCQRSRPALLHVPFWLVFEARLLLSSFPALF